MKSKKSHGSMIIMAYPDTFVRPSNEGVAKITPYLGIGTKDAVKAGHAALCLINHSNGDIHYYDFGRYITPDGKGRMRSVITDEELDVPLRAIIENDSVQNIDEILLWLYKHPEKTHGDGKLVASINSEIDLDQAELFIQNLRIKGSIPYGIFVEQGSNCSRFVADTLITSCRNQKVVQGIGSRQLLTPSPLGIVSTGSTSGIVYEVSNNIVTQRGKISQTENWKNFFVKRKDTPTHTINMVPGAQLLEGIGSSAQFLIQAENNHEYRISVFNEKGIQSCENIFTVDTSGFKITEPYTFIYDSNCDHCHIQQENTVYRFNKKEQ